MKICQEELEQAVANCSRDPIHIPGTIQAFGYLVATDTEFKEIEYVSENISDLFDHAANELIGMPTSKLFSATEIHEICGCLGHATIGEQREIVIEKPFGDVDFQILVHTKNDFAIIELIPQTQKTDIRYRFLERARSVLAIPLEEHNLKSFFNEACERLRWINGFDRVKFYQFLPDGSGEVIAESRHPDASSFLGLRFPEADIPPIARKLYAQTPIRTLADIKGDDVPIVGREGSEPLDLSLSVLRGKDQVHTQYLINMGISSTESLPIVVDGQLWGLFACHNMTPKQPDPAALSAVELIGKLISLRIQHALESRHQDDLRDCLKIANRLIVVDDSELAVADYWTQVKEDISKLIPCDGVIFSIDGQINMYGQVPEPAAHLALLALVDHNGSGIDAIDRLQERLPGVKWGNIAGALVISPNSNPAIRVTYFRNSVERNITWAGKPEKEVTIDEKGPKLNPRNSFNSYIENVQGRSDEWTAAELNIAKALQEALGQVITVQSNLRDNRHRLGSMVRELNHRVRNILSLVQSLSRHSREESRSVEAYAEALERRVIALAGAHNLLTRSEMKGALLSDIIKLELNPFNGNSGRITVSGPDILLRPDAASVMALLFHELTSNAAKYGALSDPSGKVVVNFKMEQDGIAISWAESNGPEISEPKRQGFGRSIIEEAIPFEFNGDANLYFNKTGVEASFWLPLDILLESEDIESALSPPDSLSENRVAGPDPKSDAQQTGPNIDALKRALVVEDNFVIASITKRFLLEAGFKTVDMAASVNEAISQLETQTFDFCLLDMNLQGKFSTKVAEYLTNKKIKFVFTTAYDGESSDVFDTFAADIISKPINEAELRRALNKLF